MRLEGATIRILDGPNVGRTTTTTSTGAYRFDGLTIGNANLSASATGWEESRAGVYIDGTNTLNFSIRTIAPWSRSSSGNTAFDMPTYISRVRITGSYSGNSPNFIVRVAGRLVVNELLGTGWSQTRYDGTHLASGGGGVEITNSSGVSWSFTEVR